MKSSEIEHTFYFISTLIYVFYNIEVEFSFCRSTVGVGAILSINAKDGKPSVGFILSDSLSGLISRDTTTMF